MFRSRRNNASDPARERAADIEAVVRYILNLEDDAIVRVVRPHCSAPGCGQAMILLARPNAPTRAVALDKSLETVTEADLRIALRSLA
jgi:hypothetical protein